MAKVKVLNYFNGMPKGVKPGEEVEIDDKLIEGWVKSGFIEVVHPVHMVDDDSEPVRVRGRRV